MKVKIRGIYTINIAPDKRYCGYCEWNDEGYCDLFKQTLIQFIDKKIAGTWTRRCMKCLKAEIK